MEFPCSASNHILTMLSTVVSRFAIISNQSTEQGMSYINLSLTLKTPMTLHVYWDKNIIATNKIGQRKMVEKWSYKWGFSTFVKVLLTQDNKIMLNLVLNCMDQVSHDSIWRLTWGEIKGCSSWSFDFNQVPPL